MIEECPREAIEHLDILVEPLETEPTTIQSTPTTNANHNLPSQDPIIIEPLTESSNLPSLSDSFLSSTC